MEEQTTKKKKKDRTEEVEDTEQPEETSKKKKKEKARHQEVHDSPMEEQTTKKKKKDHEGQQKRKEKQAEKEQETHEPVLPPRKRQFRAAEFAVVPTKKVKRRQLQEGEKDPDDSDVSGMYDSETSEKEVEKTDPVERKGQRWKGDVAIRFQPCFKQQTI